ncbi:MAG TPA: hypothetical protein PK095_16960, partial [Myxococcota bacterium]|nr:hypothetical protein [Myxococcota bacterium]
LTIASDGTHFVSEDGVGTSLARRPSARKIMAQLAAAHRERRALDVETLFQAGWPGDKVREPYRSNRVYVLIAKLRSAGLGAALLHDGEGYRLDPDAAIVFT